MGLLQKLCYGILKIWNARRAQGLQGSLKAFLLLIIVDIFALSMTGTVGDAVNASINSGNLSATDVTLLPLVTLLYVVCIIGANIAVVYKMFR